MGIRDEASDTQYYKISIIAQQINLLLFICLLAGVAYLTAIYFLNRHHAMLGSDCTSAWDDRKVATVLLLGLLGAALATLRGLISSNASRRAPEWVANGFVTTGRLLSGIIAGLAGYIFLVEGLLPLDKSRNIEFSVPLIFGILGEVAVMWVAERFYKDKGQSDTGEKAHP